MADNEGDGWCVRRDPKIALPQRARQLSSPPGHATATFERTDCADSEARGSQSAPLAPRVRHCTRTSITGAVPSSRTPSVAVMPLDQTRTTGSKPQISTFLAWLVMTPSAFSPFCSAAAW